MSLVLYFVNNIILTTLFFENGCWKVTAKNVRKRNKNILHLVFILFLKMHSFWLFLFVIKLYFLINIFKVVKKKHEKDSYTLCKSFEKTKTKYVKTISDMKFLKQCKQEQLIPAFANVCLSANTSNIKLKHRIACIFIEDEL